MSAVEINEQSTADKDAQEKSNAKIKEVWDGNVEEEIKNISELIDTYNYIGMDTEFPGFCITSNPDPTQKDGAYKFIKNNVDVQKIIQIGITLADKAGNFPEGICTWQFNLKFDVKNDTSSESSIELLRNAGINFNNLQEFGIDPIKMAELFISSGLAFDEEVTWVTFHGAFDFAYLLKLLSNNVLPQALDVFNNSLKCHFATTYDLKVIVNEVHEKRNYSLEKLSKELDLIRTGACHQAGSDSYLTILCFQKILKLYFKEDLSITKFRNKIYGLTPDTMYSTTVTSNLGNTGFDTSNNFYYGQMMYPQLYNGFNFNDMGNYYYDQQQVFPYAYNQLQNRLDYGMSNNNR